MADRRAEYRRYYPSEGMSLIICADFSQPASQITAAWVAKGERIEEGDERWFTTPFQVADARHRVDEAFRLVRNWGA